MSFVERILGFRRAILACVAILSLAGLWAWHSMPRQEDPDLPERYAFLTIPFPGADANVVERMVLEPLEERIQGIAEVEELRTTAGPGVGVVLIHLREDANYAEGWSRIREEVSRAEQEFPDGVHPPHLDNTFLNTVPVLLGLVGGDLLELSEDARILKRQLLSVPGVTRVEYVGNPEPRVSVRYDSHRAGQLGLSAAALRQQLRGRATLAPGGVIRAGNSRVIVRPNSEMSSAEEVAGTPILLPGGSTVPLSDIADVSYETTSPPGQMLHVSGEPAVGLSVLFDKAVNQVRVGEDVRRAVSAFTPKTHGARVVELSYQPAYVESRLSGLQLSLLLAAGIVALVVIAFTGFRMGMVVASVVPLTVLMTLGIYAMGGGVLEQVSVAALVISTGMLVDNVIVIVESIQRYLDDGLSPAEATKRTVSELALPLATATLTTGAAFLPMLLASGDVAMFTRAIPVVVLISLVVSYLAALLFSPALAERFLKPRRRVKDVAKGAGAVSRLASYVTAHPGLSIGWVGCAVVGSALLSPLLSHQFFPHADRTQMRVSVELPQGSTTLDTRAVAEEIETELGLLPEVKSVTTFVGRATPRIYYNLFHAPEQPQRADLLVTTRSRESVGPVMAWVREHGRKRWPESLVIPQRFEQGPAKLAAVELRVFAEDPVLLGTSVDHVLSAVRDATGVVDARHLLGSGTPVLDLLPDDALALRQGVSRTDIARETLAQTTGIRVGGFRRNARHVPIVVGSTAAHDSTLAHLSGVTVAPQNPEQETLQASGTLPPAGVRVDRATRQGLLFTPSRIHRRDGRRTGRVLAEIAPGHTASAAFAEIRASLAETPLPAGVQLEYGGDAEASDKAQGDLGGELPIALIIMLGALLVEFNSFRRVGIVLVSIPLCLVGVVPGLLLAGEAVSFYGLLGMIALAGIVVNNAIMLLDVADRRRAEGADARAAMRAAIQARVRPIFLTTATTMCGLLPLAFSAGPLWPPLAWTMIGGLAGSGLLTLVTAPALYVLLCSDKPVRSPATP